MLSMGGAHVIVLSLGEQVGAIDMQGGLGFAPRLFNGQHHMGGGGVIEMPQDAGQFRFHLGTQGGGDVQMVARQVDLHSVLRCGRGDV